MSKTETVDAAKAAELVFELFKQHRWLTDAGKLQAGDAAAEQEAVAFLMTIESATGWGQCSDAARRVASTLALDFMARLMHPGSPQSGTTWTVRSGEPAWRQAADVLAQEIQKAHPLLAARH